MSTVMLSVTPIQSLTLEFINQFYNENGYPPSIQEIASARNVVPNTAQGHVESLHKKGFITKRIGVSRSLILTDLGRTFIDSLT